MDIRKQVQEKLKKFLKSDFGDHNEKFLKSNFGYHDEDLISVRQSSLSAHSGHRPRIFQLNTTSLGISVIGKIESHIVPVLYLKLSEMSLSQLLLRSMGFFQTKFLYHSYSHYNLNSAGILSQPKYKQ